MSTTTPCIRGKMGNTEYFLARMNARELVGVVRAANEHDRWTDMGIEEKMQREPNKKRVLTEIAPYIAKSADRFFGSIIVVIYDTSVHFESLEDFRIKVPKAYEGQAEAIGFLTINDGGQLITLDGQHRLLALREVVSQGKEIGEFGNEVPNDQISVIFIRYEDDIKTRRIFNKVNRYAKTTTRADNLITSEDDGCAIIARKLLDDGAPLGVKDAHGKPMVNWNNNTLAARSTQFTTLSAVYEIVGTILGHEGLKDFDEKSRITRPSDEELNKAYEQAERYWLTVLQGLKPYCQAMMDVKLIPKMREEGEPYSLLFKPVAQIYMFHGLLLAMDRGLSLEEAVRRTNEVDWRVSAPLWKNILINTSGTIIANGEARDRTAELVAYLIGCDKMTPAMIEALKHKYYKATINNYEPDVLPTLGKELPDLPEPVAAARATHLNGG